MAKIITCPNCGYQQRKYTTLVEEALITCVKCNFKWVNIKSSEKKSPEVKIIMESENHYNYTIKNFTRGEKTFPVYALDSNFVEPLDGSRKSSPLTNKLPLPEADLSSHLLPLYNKNNIGSTNTRNPNYQKNYNYYNSAKLYNQGSQSNYSNHYDEAKPYVTPTQNRYKISPQAQALQNDITLRTSTTNPYTPKPTTYNSGSTYQGYADVSKYTNIEKPTEKPSNIPLAQGNSFKHEQKIENTSTNLEANNNVTSSQMKDHETTGNLSVKYKNVNVSDNVNNEEFKRRDIYPSTNETKRKEVSQQHPVASQAKLKEFTYKKDKLNKIKQEIEEYNKNAEQKIQDKPNTEKVLQPNKNQEYLRELDKVLYESQEKYNPFNNNKGSKLEVKKPKKSQEKDINPAKINVLNNRKTRAKIYETEEFSNYKKMQKDLVDNYQKQKRGQLKMAASALSELEHTLYNYASTDLDLSIAKEKKYKRKKIKLLRDDVTYGELFTHIKNKYFDFSNLKNIFRLSIYACLIVVIIVGFNFNTFFDIDQSPPTLKVPNKAVSAIPTIDDGTINKAIRPLKAEGDLPSVLSDSQLSSEAKLEDMNVEKEEDKSKEILSLNKDDLLNKAQFGFEQEINPNPSTIKSEENSSGLGKHFSKYTNPASFAVKRLSFNILNDINISSASIKWLESLGEKTLQTSVIITNKSRDKSYTIYSLELIFTDGNGNILNRKLITPNKTLSSLESIKLNIKSSDASIVTRNVYVFVKNYSK